MTVPEGQYRVPVAASSVRDLRQGHIWLTTLTAEARSIRDVSEITWAPIAQCRMCRRRQRQHGNIEQKRCAQRAQQGSHRARQQSGGLRVARTATHCSALLSSQTKEHTHTTKHTPLSSNHQIIKSSNHQIIIASGTKQKRRRRACVRTRFLQAVSPAPGTMATHGVLLVLVAIVALVPQVARATASHDNVHPFQFQWQLGSTHTYHVDTKWWLATSPSSTIDESLANNAWDPPVGPMNSGIRCTVAVEPVARETWPAQNAGQRSDNAWLLKIAVSSCVPLRSRFHGDYVALPQPPQADLDSDPATRRVRTPFFAVQTDEGRVRRVLFFGNETLSSRNFKRGCVAFLSQVQPSADQGRQLRAGSDTRVAYSAVDHDENGVCVLSCPCSPACFTYGFQCLLACCCVPAQVRSPVLGRSSCRRQPRAASQCVASLPAG